MVDPNLIYQISEYRMLVEDNDYYFILYLAHILKHIESKQEDCITDFGIKSLEFNISPTLCKFRDEDSSEKVSQSELLQFCLYVANCNQICEKMLNKISLYKQDKDGFKNQNKLPDCVLDDFVRFEDKINILAPLYKKVAETYDTCLGLKHQSVYNKKKYASFLMV